MKEPERYKAVVLDLRWYGKNEEIIVAYSDVDKKAYELDEEGRTTTFEVTKFKFIRWTEK